MSFRAISAEGRLSPLWNSVDQSPSRIGSPVPESVRNRLTQRSPLHEAVCLLNQAKSTLGNRNALQIEDFKKTETVIGKVTEMAYKHGLGSIDLKLANVSKDFDEIKEEVKLLLAFKYMALLEENALKPTREKHFETFAIYKKMQGFFSAETSKPISYKPLQGRFEAVQRQIEAAISSSLKKLDFLMVWARYADGELMDADELTKINGLFASTGIENCIDFMDEEVQKKTRSKLDWIETLLQDLNSRTSPNSVMEFLGL